MGAGATLKKSALSFVAVSTMMSAATSSRSHEAVRNSSAMDALAARPATTRNGRRPRPTSLYVGHSWTEALGPQLLASASAMASALLRTRT